MSVEIWKSVVGYEGLYEVSSFGRVKSLGRIDRFNKKWNCRIMKPTYVGKHYQMVRLCKDGKTKNMKVHRLVAETFIENSENKPHVNHIDEDKTNNSSMNLEWVTHIENVNHGTRNKRISEAMTNNPLTSKPVIAISKETNQKTYFCSISEASRKTNIQHSRIKECIKGIRKSAGGYIWQFTE